ncbi:hypothetical protein BC940DRAFT_300529 [Gongronella butleri]|nr:hypothetical protein BC940DRAFT_300529 [Gongronella butleri]
MSQDAYLAMLNNPVINPPAGASTVAAQQAGSELRRASQCCVRVSDEAQACQDKLAAASNDLTLASEADMPWMPIQVPSDAGLPLSGDIVAQLRALGIHRDQLDENDDDNDASHVQKKTLKAFCAAHPDAATLEPVFDELFANDVQVYLIGQRTIDVYVLGWLKTTKALVGLQSALVET